MKPTQSDTDFPKLVATFAVDGEPVSKSRARFTKRGSKTFAYTPEKTKAGEERIAWAYRSAVKGSPTDPEIAYRVEAHFFNGTRQRRDVDNMVKLILDGLNGVAWVDDNQVTQIEARKAYVGKDHARTEVSVYEVGRLNPPKVECPQCGKQFRTYDSWETRGGGKIHCSAKCGREARRIARTVDCVQCGEPFEKQDARAQFCSRACVSESRQRDYECSICGSTYRGTASHGKGRRTFVCSDECRATHKATLSTACANGHPWTEANTGYVKGARRCRSCAREWAANRRATGRANPTLTIEET